MGLDKAQQVALRRIDFGPATGMRIDCHVFQKTTGRINSGQLRTGAQARINTKHSMATGWCCQQQVTQVFRKDSNRFIISSFFCLQP